MDQHLQNRLAFLHVLTSEIFGPGGIPESLWTKYEMSPIMPPYYEHPIDLNDDRYIDRTNKVFSINEDIHDYYKPRYYHIPQAEILRHKPSLKYGVGVLFPIEGDEQVFENEPTFNRNEEQPWSDEDDYYSSADSYIGTKEEEDTSADPFNTTTMGISCVLDLSKAKEIEIDLSGGIYQPVPVILHFSDFKKDQKNNTAQLTWWLRTQVNRKLVLNESTLKRTMREGSYTQHILFEHKSIDCLGERHIEPVRLKIDIKARKHHMLEGNPLYQRVDPYLVTITLMNTGCYSSEEEKNKKTLFQSRFAVTCKGAILPYPDKKQPFLNSEAASLDLLYRHQKTYGIGHLCAATWDELITKKTFAIPIDSINANPLPVYETPSITPSITYNGQEFTLPIRNFAGIENESYLWGNRLMSSIKAHEIEPINNLINAYQQWIDQQKCIACTLSGNYQKTARKHIKACIKTLERMQEGREHLKHDPHCVYCFRLTNRAMLWQAYSGKSDSNIDIEKFCLTEDQPRSWRPFQLAFLLINLCGLSQGGTDRDIVDLIWFPTGGGKTEAYLSCAAFSMFYRRLTNPSDDGTDVIMRYTLRLLTVQQFQRASSLICAMEIIRRKEKEIWQKSVLGDSSYSIGLWVGQDNTPNSYEKAFKSCQEAEKNGLESYKMVLLKCPWCGETMGPCERSDRTNKYDLKGIFHSKKSCSFICPNERCCFSETDNNLPISIIDEHLYQNPPTFLIATVDKFAMLPFEPKIQRFFGTRNGNPINHPPSLIIQDELHLITGPLGSSVGLYESLIDSFCSKTKTVKYIAATATTRSSGEQISALFGRTRSQIFPPVGLDADDSFFATYKKEASGTKSAGRMYVGVFPLNYKSGLVASQRVFASLMAGAQALLPEQRDPWWTNLIFFNSLRELGNNLTLFHRPILDHLKLLQKSLKKDVQHRYSQKSNILELTSRITSAEIPSKLNELSTPYNPLENKSNAIDASLASNLIEVGVDVDRLCLMSVVCQPKSTSQYIQATGRIGRKKQGLVIVNYMTKRPRDASTYEHFQSYHSKLYSHVEPSSVTPFSYPLLERAIHAVLSAWTRLSTDESLQTVQYDEQIINEASEYLRNKIKLTNASKAILNAFEEILSNRKEMIKSAYEHQLKWSENTPSNTNDVFMTPMSNPHLSTMPNSLGTPMSMRSVDSDVMIQLKIN